MRHGTAAILLTAAAWGGALAARAEVTIPPAPGGENQYQAIVARNAFALNPIPVATNTGPVAPPSTVDVYITGITTLSGTKKVLLQVTEKGKQPDYLSPLLEGDGQGRIEVVSIDPDKGAAVVKIDGNEKTLTLDKDSPRPGGGPGGGPPPGKGPPGGPMPNPAGTIPLPGVTTAGAAAAAAHPGAAATGRMGVMMGGATSGVPSPAAAASPAASMTREQAIAHIEEQRRLYNQAANAGLAPNRIPPLPPTALTPKATDGAGTAPASN